MCRSYWSVNSVICCCNDLWIACDTCRITLFLFKQKMAYEMRISDWSSDVCSSDLHDARKPRAVDDADREDGAELDHHLEHESRRPLKPEKIAQEDKVAGRRYGDELGPPLDDNEEQGFGDFRQRPAAL